MRLTASILATSAIGCCVLAQAQTIKPDTLEDLKAEYEFQQQRAAPFIQQYQAAKEARHQCALRVFDAPLTTSCTSQDRDILVAQNVATEPIKRLIEAKEAFEREQRKADRQKGATNPKP